MRYHLHVAGQTGGTARFQTQEADQESVATATASLLARRGHVVWLHEHDHDADAYRELGMFIGDRFLPTRAAGGREHYGHRLH